MNATRNTDPTAPELVTEPADTVGWSEYSNGELTRSALRLAVADAKAAGATLGKRSSWAIAVSKTGARLVVRWTDADGGEHVARELL